MRHDRVGLSPKGEVSRESNRIVAALLSACVVASYTRFYNLEAQPANEYPEWEGARDGKRRVLVLQKQGLIRLS